MYYNNVKKQVINYLKKWNYSKKQLQPLINASNIDDLLFYTIEITAKTTGQYQWSKLRISHSHAIVKTYDTVIWNLINKEMSNDAEKCNLNKCEMEILDLYESYYSDIYYGLLLHDIFKYLDNGIEHGENAAIALEGQLQNCVIDAIRFHSHKDEYFNNTLINLFMDLDRLCKFNNDYMKDCIKFNKKECIANMYKKTLNYEYRLDVCDKLFNNISANTFLKLIEK